MKANIGKIAVALLLLIGGSLFAGDPFVEQSGMVCFEIESEPTVGSWQKKTSINDFTGTGYYVWTGAQYTDKADAGNGTITYHIQINNPGNYELRIRSCAGTGNDYREHNDTWIRFPTGQNVTGEYSISGWTKFYVNKLLTWDWKTATLDNYPQEIRQYLSAGVHEFQISARSSYHALDRVVIFKYDQHSFNASNFTKLSQSPRTTDDTVDPPEPTVYSLPGKVEAEDYSSQSGTQTEATNDAGGGSSVGYIQNGDYLEFLVNVAESKRYGISYRVASENSGGNIVLSSGGNTIATTAVSATGGWQTWTTVSENVSLTSGEQTWRLTFTGGSSYLFNLNYFSVGDTVNEIPTGVIAAGTGARENGFSVHVTHRSRKELNLKYSLDDDAIVSYEVCDMLGKKIYRSENSMRQAGTHSGAVQLSSPLANGIYWIRLKADGRSTLSRLILTGK